MTKKKAFTVEYTDSAAAPSSCFSDLLYEQYCNGQYVDVILCIQQDSVSVHSFLLAVESNLLNQFVAPHPNNISIDLTKTSILIKHLKSVIDYMYKRRISLDMNNIQSILKLSQFASFQSLLIHCKQFLLSRMQPTNCLKIWRIARNFHLPDIEIMSVSLIREVFWQLCYKNGPMKDLDDNEMEALIETVGVPRKPLSAFAFLTRWLSVNFLRRMNLVCNLVRTLIPMHCVSDILTRFNFLFEHEQYWPLLKVLQTMDLNLVEICNNYYKSPFSAKESWILVLSEKNMVSLYFPTENQWTTLQYETDQTESIGILGQNVLSWDDLNKQIEVLNLENLTTKHLPPCSQTSEVFSCQYFCANTGIHTAIGHWNGRGVKVIIWRYTFRWEKQAEMLLSFSAQTAYMRVEPCPTDVNIVYVLITSQSKEEEMFPVTQGCLLLMYDSLKKKIIPVFTSNSWAPPVNGRLLCIYDTINFIQDSSLQSLKSVTQGHLTIRSIIGRNETKVIDIPIPNFKKQRPENITILTDMADNMTHFNCDKFTCFADNLFWLQQVSPTVVDIRVYNFCQDEDWIRIPASPLLGLSDVKIQIFSRNSVLRGGFLVNNEKQLPSKHTYPLINLTVDGWNGEILTIPRIKSS